MKRKLGFTLTLFNLAFDFVMNPHLIAQCATNGDVNRQERSGMHFSGNHPFEFNLKICADENIEQLHFILRSISGMVNRENI